MAAGMARKLQSCSKMALALSCWTSWLGGGSAGMGAEPEHDMFEARVASRLQVSKAGQGVPLHKHPVSDSCALCRLQGVHLVMRCIGGAQHLQDSQHIDSASKAICMQKGKALDSIRVSHASMVVCHHDRGVQVAARAHARASAILKLNVVLRDHLTATFCHPWRPACAHTLCKGPHNAIHMI